MHLRKFLFFSILIIFFTTALSAQVLGPCGSAGEKTKTPPAPKEAKSLAVQPLPLPGQNAIDFQLTAVVGDEIKNIKLSDYNGKWRVLCFFPAAFTFV